MLRIQGLNLSDLDSNCTSVDLDYGETPKRPFSDSIKEEPSRDGYVSGRFQRSVLISNVTLKTPEEEAWPQL